MRLFWTRISFVAVGFAAGWLAHDWKPQAPVAPPVVPTALSSTSTESSDGGGVRDVTLDDVLSLAREALQHTIENVDDYTAVMSKHEQDQKGVLQPPSEMFVKVATRHRGGQPGQPLKVYLKFQSPDSVRGREVIWIEDQNDGKLQVREAGFMGAMMTASIDPTGFLAMQGQRYPITEIGLTNLISKLVERGEQARSETGVKVTMADDYVIDGENYTLIQLQRSKPNGRDDDFSLAEVVIDLEKQIVIEFRSFGWPAADAPDDQGAPPLIESYRYRDVKLNVGLRDIDFDVSNPDYTFAESK
ncbi:MAG: DUF1571 domain-containing protein [Planctomycetota bacterium]